MANWPTHRARQAERRHRRNAERRRREYDRKGITPKRAKLRDPLEPIPDRVWENLFRRHVPVGGHPASGRAS